MSKKSCCVLLFIAALSLTSQAQAQEEEGRWRAIDLAATYTTERAQIVSAGCSCFWMQGGSVDAATRLFRGLSVAASLTGEHKSNLGSGVDLSKISFMAGPRYSYATNRWTKHVFGEKRQSGLFGEALFGIAHGFNSTFPVSSGLESSANSFSMQIGGGLNLHLAKGFGLRVFELDYVRTSFPNNGTNSQNDLRLAFGVSYHLHKR